MPRLASPIPVPSALLKPAPAGATLAAPLPNVFRWDGIALTPIAQPTPIVPEKRPAVAPPAKVFRVNAGKMVSVEVPWAAEPAYVEPDTSYPRPPKTHKVR